MPEREDGSQESYAVRLSALIYNAPLAILVLDREHKIQLANPAFTEMFHYENHEAVGRSLVQLITRGADFLQKPFTLEVLGQRLRSLIDRYK